MDFFIMTCKKSVFFVLSGLVRNGVSAMDFRDIFAIVAKGPLAQKEGKTVKEMISGRNMLRASKPKNK